MQELKLEPQDYNFKNEWGNLLEIGIDDNPIYRETRYNA